MTDSILENKWIPWHPKKIFLKNTKKNKKVLYFFDKFKEEDFFKDLKDEKTCVENQNKSELKKDLTKTEAYKTGFKKGLLESKEEYCVLEKKLNNLFLDFENGLCMFENALYSELLKTVLKISSYVIGKKIDIDESILLKHAKKIIEKDGIFLKKPQLIVHPNNKILIEKVFKDLLNAYKWKLVYDDNVDINSCKVKSESGDIDTTVNARWQELCRLVYSEEEC